MLNIIYQYLSTCYHINKSLNCVIQYRRSCPHSLLYFRLDFLNNPSALCLVSGFEEHIGYIDFWIHNFQDLYAYTCNRKHHVSLCNVRVHGSGWKHHEFPEIDTGTMLGYLPQDIKVPYSLRMTRVEDYQCLSREREETGTHLTGRG